MTLACSPPTSTPVRRAGIRRSAGPAALACLLALGAGSAQARDLRMGLSAEPTSVDPHFHNLGPNNALRRHIFEGLIDNDPEMKLIPALALSWTARDDRTWEFKLRPDVRFSDGSPFTANDVIYTFCRVPLVENSPSSFATFVKPFTAVEAPDPLTVVIKTDRPLPLLPNNLTAIGLLSAKASGAPGAVTFAQGGCSGMGTPPKSTDFANPKVAVGTGPYALKEYVRGTQVVLTKNPAYWGRPATFDTVTMKPIPSTGPRVAALLAGDVDLIESPAIQDLPRIEGAGFSVAKGLSNRIIYIHLDQFDGPDWKTPTIRGADGKPLPANPLRDVRVREALSKAIDRKAIVERVMGGVAQAAGELLPFPLSGTTQGFPVVPYDPKAAKELLAQAGYPNGFEITLGTPNDRYVNDEKIAQVVAQMWTRIGVKTGIDAATASTFFTRRNAFAFSAYLAGWGADSGELSNSLNSLLLCFDPATGRGFTNRGRYCNREVDRLTIEAMGTFDAQKREALLRQASALAMQDYPLIPLHFEVSTWATAKGLRYRPRIDQYTLAMDVEVVK
ncbi:ABC transporter substrate-binding protein [Methylobacterium sp. NEAU 140]|uniref:ABC transporter substrate-binding protein n=1 Tax=Methylobacterium sp. NEAU 140 TaxID=3064945 RepID=UPI0027368CB0|nr:ABC transporter substrate-binding protein [Methylobacterium sp. NEAU 140]MDP4022943.1 ABC transporter substrate-binding protein [Methylobacterium sp. NEAU 140]